MVSGFSARLRRNRCILVLDGYVDDSGSGHGKIAVLAGFLSTADRWRNFSDDLENLCEQEPKTPDFKMVKAMDHRVYWPATRQQLDKRIEDVAGLTVKHAMYRIDVQMHREAYDCFVKGRVPKKIDDPYFLLFYNVILASVEFMGKMNMEGTVEFVFDEQGKVGERARSLYYSIKEYTDAKVRQYMGGEPVFKHDRDLLPLKSADLLAYQLRRHFDLEQPQGVPHNDIVDEIIARLLGVSCQIRPEDLQLFAANISHGLLFRSTCVYHVPE